MRPRDLAKAKARHALQLAQAAGYRKRRIKRAEPDGLARKMRKGPSNTKVAAGNQGGPNIPGLNTSLGAAAQIDRQFAATQKAKQFLFDQGRASSPKVTGQDLLHGVSVSALTTDKHGLPSLRSVKLAPRASAWAGPAVNTKTNPDK